MRPLRFAPAIPLLLLILAAALRAPQLRPDTESYLAWSPIRPPLYPLILASLQRVLGAGYAQPLPWIQACLGGLSAWWLAFRGWDRIQPLPSVLRWPLCWLLFLPHLAWANHVLTESLAYSVLLVLAGQCAWYVEAPTVRRLGLILLLVVSCLMLRNQAAYLLPAIALLPVLRPVAGRRWAPAAGCLLIPLLVSGLAGRVFNKLEHGEFLQVGVGGQHVLTIALSLAAPDTCSRLSPADSALVTPMYEEANRRGLLDRQRAELSSGEAFRLAFNPLLYEIILPGIRESLQEQKLPEVSEWMVLDQRAGHLAIQMLRQYPARYAWHMLRELWRSRGYLGVLTILLAVLWLGMAWRNPSDWNVTSAWVGLAAAGNYLLILPSVWLNERFTFPTETMLVCWLLLTAWKAAKATK